jgi:hypothetical protein
LVGLLHCPSLHLDGTFSFFPSSLLPLSPPSSTLPPPASISAPFVNVPFSPPVLSSPSSLSPPPYPFFTSALYSRF